MSKTDKTDLSNLIGIHAGETKKSQNMFRNLSPVPECRNKNSYGTICMRCNQCRRFDVKMRNGKKYS